MSAHGTYMRKVPQVAWVARWYCPQAHATIGLLPDFYASRMPGALDTLEETVARVEKAETIEKAADELRPADAPDAVHGGLLRVLVHLTTASVGRPAQRPPSDVLRIPARCPVA